MDSLSISVPYTLMVINIINFFIQSFPSKVNQDIKEFCKKVTIFAINNKVGPHFYNSMISFIEVLMKIDKDALPHSELALVTYTLREKGYSRQVKDIILFIAQ